MKKMHEGRTRFSGRPLWIRILIPVSMVLAAVLAIGVPILLSRESTEAANDMRSVYSEGMIAGNDVVSQETFYYIDEAETRRLQREAEREVSPRFGFSLSESAKTLDVLDALFALYVPEGGPFEADGRSQAVSENPGVSQDVPMIDRLSLLDDGDRQLVESIAREAATKLLSRGVFDGEELSKAVSDGYRQVSVTEGFGLSERGEAVERDISSLATSAHVETALLEYLRTLGSHVPAELQEIAFDAVMAAMRPNVLYDGVATESARQEAMLAVAPVTVRIEQGQYILKKDYVVTSDELKALQAMRLASSQYSATQLVGRVLFVFIVIGGAVYALHLEFLHSRREYQFILIFLFGVVLTQAATYFILRFASGLDMRSLDPLLPVLALPIAMSLITNRKRAGMISALTLGSFDILLPSATTMTVFFVVAISFCGIHFLRYVSRRIDMIYQWFFSVVASAFLVVLANLLNGFGFGGILPLITAVAVNVSAAYVFVTVFLPIADTAFNIPTAFRLRELAYGDSPALLRLARVAQGTYSHSLMVADLAYAGAQAIGADSLLARVGALYHDIGKQEHPEYFIENQSGDNKHDDLKASLSVAIIKSHVKIGIEKGREARLPQEVLDIIGQHHGNDVMAVFFREAQDEAVSDKNNRQVKEQDYSYTGEPPQTPEAAIVMLADSVEAASRTIRKPSPQKYERLVNQIIMEKIERKQLFASGLSLTDLDTVARIFVQTLAGRYHSRIEYPDASGGEK